MLGECNKRERWTLIDSGLNRSVRERKRRPNRCKIGKSDKSENSIYTRENVNCLAARGNVNRL